MPNVYHIIDKRLKLLSIGRSVSVFDILKSRFFWITLSEPCSSLESAVDAVLRIGIEQR